MCLVELVVAEGLFLSQLTSVVCARTNNPTHLTYTFNILVGDLGIRQDPFRSDHNSALSIEVGACQD